MKNNRGFTLLEVTIVAGLMAMVGVYMMQMTSNLNKSIARMETKADEQELMYITTLALTDKLACQRTLGSYCENNATGKAGKLAGGVYAATQSDCDSVPGAGMGATWKNNEFQLQEWPSSDDFKVSNINSSNSIDLGEDISSGTSPSHSAMEGKIYNRNFGIVFKACRVDFNLGAPPWTSMIQDFLPEFIDQANAIADSTPSMDHLPIASCQEHLYYVGKSLLMKKFFVANYPEDQGGVPVGTGSGEVGKVKFVFEYARLKEKGKIMRKDIDLYVQTNDQDEIVSCLSATDVETFAGDATYLVQVQGGGNNCTNATGGLVNGNGRPTGTTNCFEVRCGDGDEIINGDAITSNQQGVICDLALNSTNTANCTPANCFDTNDRYTDTCPPECKGLQYSKYQCRLYGTAGNLSGARAICARRYSN